MKALILAGGKGTRLRPLTVYTPKPIVPVMNRPFLSYQLELLSRAGISGATLSLNYQPNKIEDTLGDGSDLGVAIDYVTEPSPLGTAGAFRFAADKVETTVVLNGDILSDIDLSAMISQHRGSGAAATIALARVPDPSAYGLVEIDDDGAVLRFIEKPSAASLSEIKTDLINAGIYILEPSVLELIPQGENRSFEYDVFPMILSKGMGFNSFVLEDNYWRDIGTPASYLQAHLDLLAGKFNFLVSPNISHSELATTAFVDKRSVIAEGCVLKPGVRIENSVIGPGVFIEEKSLIKDSVLWSHSRVSSSAEIRGAVLCRSCHIGRNVVVGEGSVLGDKASIPDYSKV
ncbi:sugar phosphate nucleotidyltransferase [Leptolyngbya sp. 7M]|uniref:sugar phosphate nucleotidyltransferase n=1 Tax=Leptolyngbya sp. 7M TaxID=2812896 RepID=UPI001B8B09AF|nr:NDP-sugar synthase [Leptolyngbya sp. 7M]QYO65783.1 NDP-sugar synthase [Leptolyngbya sp. 7M]